MIPTSIIAAQIDISLKSKTTPNIKTKNINKSRFLSITFFSFNPPTQTSTAHTATHEPRHKRCDCSRRSSKKLLITNLYYQNIPHQ